MSIKTTKITAATLSTALLLGACAGTSPSSKHQDVLYQEFQEFKKLAKKDLALAKETKVAASYVNVIEEANAKIPEEFRSPFFKDLADKLITEYSHYEINSGSRGCLTINGLNDKDKPESLSLYYVKEEDDWIFNYVMMATHDSIREYYTEATCPDPGEYR